MRNVDRIRVLENQLEHERKQTAQLRKDNTTLVAANRQIREMTDAVITEIVKRYGEKREEDGKLLGYRLATAKVDVKAALEAWEIFVEDQGDDRIIGIAPREADNGHEQ